MMPTESGEIFRNTKCSRKCNMTEGDNSKALPYISFPSFVNVMLLHKTVGRNFSKSEAFKHSML